MDRNWEERIWKSTDLFFEEQKTWRLKTKIKLDLRNISIEAEWARGAGRWSNARNARHARNLTAFGVRVWLAGES